MATLIPVKYHDCEYPEGIQPHVKEVPGHLDVSSLRRVDNYSLHTEFSSPRRRLRSPVLQRFPTLRMANRDGVPLLWFGKRWAEEFAGFIQSVIGENGPPLVIEIHPPYEDYCPSVEQFCEAYELFEDHMLSVYPETEILIENRFGSKHKTGNFLISSYQSIGDLVSYLDKVGFRLSLVLDFPQLMNQMGGVPSLSTLQIKNMFTVLGQCRDRIRGIHLWGMRHFVNGRFLVHAGNLNTLFQDNMTLKQTFLQQLHDLLDDGVIRYFVPEVSNDRDLSSIVKDLAAVGFSFEKKNLINSFHPLFQLQISNV